ncbi:hypothetical protein ACJJTC_016463 [Scirpophaga incertulas]
MEYSIQFASRSESTAKKRRHTKEESLDIKKNKLIDTAQALLNQSESSSNTSSFGTYVNEKLNKIVSGQREIAEKLISDVLFLAQTKNLRFDSKIETPSLIHPYNPMSYYAPSPGSSSDYPIDQYAPYKHQINYRKFSPSARSSPSSYTHRQITPQPPTSPENSDFQIQSPYPVSFHSSQSSPHPSTSPPANSALHVQSPPPSNIQHPQSSPSYSYQSSHPVSFHSSQLSPHPAASPSANSALHVQSPLPPSDIQHPQPSTSYMPNELYASENVSDKQAVLYAEGPAGEVLKELLIFRKNK